jgi:hypothetical protein
VRANELAGVPSAERISELTCGERPPRAEFQDEGPDLFFPWSSARHADALRELSRKLE